MGRSLSLVSRYIHNASSPVKHQSVVVRGLHQTLALASTGKHKRVTVLQLVVLEYGWAAFAHLVQARSVRTACIITL
ncbi:hypothetical protein PILCRDRAFT_819603 [Piloderma croceum F 1598]|uniref:Uncharacterized protein n=1 Tax=Piloderma croceum (strain F 1598) TaxID=765440 RepID=A0A0C3C197_PILCF|nr:hypothetical protein PILCRDRAFT_819603 [Piloderma croceum F 1598]